MSESRIHKLLDVPELDYMSVSEDVTDWRLGRRVVIVRPKLSLGWGCNLMLLAPPLAVLAIGALISLATGERDVFLFAATIAIFISAAIVGLFVVPFTKGGGRRETIMDWDTGTFTHRYRWRSRVHPFRGVQALRVVGREESGQPRKSAASLEAQVDGQSYLIFETRSTEEPAQTSCAKLAMAALRLSESLSVPCQITIGSRTVDREEVLRLGRSTAEVAQKYLQLASHVRGWMMLAEYEGKADEAERHRAEAVFHYVQAHAVDPSRPEPLLEIGRLSGDADVHQRAVEVAIQLDPNNTAALLERANLLFLDDELDEAMNLYTQVIQREPSVKAYQGRADVHQELDQFDRAVSDLTAAIEIQPDDALCYSRRANCLMTWHDESQQPRLLDEALADYDTAIRLSPDNDALQTNRCSVLKAAGRADEAIAELSRIIAANPNSFYPLTLRGELYLESGRAPQAALDDFSEVLKLLQADPQHSDPSLRQVQAVSIGTAFRYRAEALRQLGRLIEANRDEQSARELLDGED